MSLGYSGLPTIESWQHHPAESTIEAVNSFSADLPHLQHAFEEALSDLRKQVSAYAGALTEEIILITQQLCDPDPTKRGDPRWKGSLVANYDLQTYISKLDRLYRRVEVNLK